ncbi:trigger factor [Parasulfuritortus cantonensis]|uniref:Trigger factor n=1 Tax=Parasulfuritortus cantonensis TaxID=2528202 RepID=A0A4R1B6F5_9PROT|nr:trigger factor [Parasulfuritortus cantonensis]TCJ11495.1 trigger factor [Parasulfuritortus cantonensis]
MSATVETLAGLERRITLNLNPVEIETEVGKRLQKMSRNVKLDGFRPGKAPAKMVAMRYGSEVRGEVLGDALHKEFIAAVEANKLDVAGYPHFEPAGEGIFNATFEVYPDIAIGNLGQIQVTRPVVEVIDADVDRTLDVLRKQRVRFAAVERASENGDRVHIDYAGKIGGVPFQGGEAKDFPLILGEGRTLPDFEGSLVGMTAGASKTFDVKFPDDYFAKELAGQTATFEATVKSVHAPILPEVDEAFAESLGIKEGGPAKLREEIAANLGREAKRRIQARLKEQVMDGLLAVSPFDVPRSLVAMEVRSLMDHAVNDLKARGMKEQDIKLSESVFEPQAKRRVALSLLLNSFAAAHQIGAGDEQVRAKVDEFAQSYEDPTEVVAWYYQDANRLRDVKAMVIEDNVVEAVLQSAQVTDEPTTLENLMGKA